MKVKPTVISASPEKVFESEVVKGGNGGVIKFFKKHIGKKVLVVLKG